MHLSLNFWFICVASFYPSLPPFELVPRLNKMLFSDIIKEMALNNSADIFPERFVMTPARYKGNFSYFAYFLRNVQFLMN